MYFFIILVAAFAVYIIYTNYTIQVILRKIKRKSEFIDKFVGNVRGVAHSVGYFAPNEKVIFTNDFKALSNRLKVNYSLCYDVVIFNTPDCEWELFFHLVKEGVSFKEIMTIRCFSKHYRLKSEASVEKNYGRVNILANNRYLGNILEHLESRGTLKDVLKKTGDSMYFNGRIMSYKIHATRKDNINSDTVLEIITGLDKIKNSIFKKDTLEY